MLDVWFMYKKFKTFYLVNMFRELLVFFVLFKIFVYLKKKKSIFILLLFGIGYILLILFIV